MGRIRKKFRPKSVNAAQLQEIEEAALIYPQVGAEDFQSGFLFSQQSGKDVFEDIKAENVEISAGKPVRLPGAERDVPSYTLKITGADGAVTVLKDRVALAGIGSNSSRNVMARKFHHFKAEDVPLAVCVIPAEIRDHAIVHGAFVGASGPVPATIHAHSGSVSKLTVGFYDAKAAAHMTGTEPNYEGVLLDAAVELQNGLKINQALAYVAVWGALADPDNPQQPLALSSIPAQTSLKKLSNKEALALAVKITDGTDVSGLHELQRDQKLKNYARENFQDENRRIGRIAALQQHSIAPNIKGRRIFSADFTKNPKVAALLQKQPRRSGASPS
ncbi:MAG: hypothetical protein EA357_01670 [Micavibrio sp.]|nr:MAG: hypothetical protein EA357_01670 [Micavibrio sp.]